MEYSFCTPLEKNNPRVVRVFLISKVLLTDLRQCAMLRVVPIHPCFRSLALLFPADALHVTFKFSGHLNYSLEVLFFDFYDVAALAAFLKRFVACEGDGGLQGVTYLAAVL